MSPIPLLSHFIDRHIARGIRRLEPGRGTSSPMGRHCPICGGGNPRDAAGSRTFPAGVFMENRTPYSVDESRRMIAAMRNAGGNPRYDEYPGVGHNCWEKVYRESKCYIGCGNRCGIRTLLVRANGGARPLICRRSLDRAIVSCRRIEKHANTRSHARA